MGRPLCIRQYDFAYAITTRCNNKEFLLIQQKVYHIFEDLFHRLASIPKSEEDPSPKYEFQVHHLLVMTNHYHLIISVKSSTPIDRIMQLINSIVARRVNKLLGRSGHLWGDRYKSKILDTIDYLKNAIAYLYQNPLKAKIVTDSFEFLRSTLKYYLTQKLPTWMTPDPLLQSIPPPHWKVVLMDLVVNGA